MIRGFVCLYSLFYFDHGYSLSWQALAGSAQAYAEGEDEEKARRAKLVLECLGQESNE